MTWIARALALVVATIVAFGVAPASADHGDDVRLLVGYRDRDAASALLRSVGARTVEHLGRIGADEVAIPAAKGAATIAFLERSKAIAYVEADAPVRAAEVTPNDQLFQHQWGPVKVRAPEAWTTTTGSPLVTVAVLDTGIDGSHPDLPPVAAGIDFVNNDADATDDNGHGTSTAGVLAARSNNLTGMAGYCWSCTLLPVKVLDAEGTGVVSEVARGITWAADRGARIINLSLSSETDTFTMRNAVAYAYSKGAVIVAAAGNESSTAPNYPAALAEVVGVAGTTSSDTLYRWSNYGDWVDVAAPGCNVATDFGGGYKTFCGTSSATPAVSALAALALSARPGLSASQIGSLLTSTAVPVGPIVSSGRVDAAAIVGTAKATSVPPTAPENVTAVARDRSATVSWRPPSSDGGGITSYRVTASPGVTSTTVPGSTTNAVVTGLENGTAYTFTVVAVNQSGDGAASSPSAAVTPTFAGMRRVAGQSRTETAVALSREAFSTAASVVVARNDAYPDGLTAAPLAAKVGGPLLLTDSASLSPVVADEVRRLGARTAWVVGGLNALTADVELGLRAAGVTIVNRIAGTNRFDTARLIAAEVGGASVYVTEGANSDPARGWPDAVAVSALAALQRRPILLVTAAGVPTETAAALTGLGATSATVVGGPAAVPDAVVTALGVPAKRVAGSTRYETSRAVADLALAAGASAIRTWLATGLDWPDALAAGPAAAARGAVLLLADGKDLNGSPPVTNWLTANRSILDQLVLIGGTSTISALAESQAYALLN